MDIVEKIDEVLNEIELANKYKFISQEDAIHILEQIIEEIPEDKFLLETIQDCIIKNWKISNVNLIEKFYKILAYYGILDEENVARKTILESKGKTIIRKFVTLKNKDHIKSLL